MLDRDRPGIPPGALIGRLTWANTSDRSGRYRPYRPYSPCRPGPRDTGRLLSVGLHEGDLGQRAALHPLIEDGLRPRTVRAVAADELLGITPLGSNCPPRGPRNCSVRAGALRQHARLQRPWRGRP